MAHFENNSIVHRLIQVGEAFRDCFTVVDANTESRPCIYINSVFTSQTGFTPEQAIGKNLAFLQGPDTDPEAVQFMQKSFHEKAACCVDILNYHCDGHAFINRLVMLPIEIANQLFYLGFQNAREYSATTGAQQSLSTPGEINHYLNNQLAKIVMRLDLASMNGQEESEALAECLHIFEAINTFCTDIDKPEKFKHYNPFALAS